MFFPAVVVRSPSRRAPLGESDHRAEGLARNSNVWSGQLLQRRGVQSRLDHTRQETATEHPVDGEGSLHHHAQLEEHPGENYRDGHSHVPQVSSRDGHARVPRVSSRDGHARDPRVYGRSSKAIRVRVLGPLKFIEVL